MRHDRKIIISILWVIIGAVLIICYLRGTVEEFWNGIGYAFLFIGILQIIRQIKYKSDSDYREKVDTGKRDERNKFLSGRAWAWAGYIFVLITAAAVVIFKLMGEDKLMFAAAASVCTVLMLYWVSFIVLRRKY